MMMYGVDDVDLLMLGAQRNSAAPLPRDESLTLT